MNHEFPINLAADAIVRFCIANANILHFRITNAEERGMLYGLTPDFAQCWRRA